jgi:Domain of unknown function (DUF4129)
VAVRTLPAVVLILLAFPHLLRAEAAPSPEPISLQDYVSEIQLSSVALGGSGSDRTELRRLERSLPKQWAVRAGSQIYIVDTEWLAADLAKGEVALEKKDLAALEQIRQDLAAHGEAAEALARSEGARNLGNSKAKLNRILAAKEFQALHGPGWLQGLRARVYEWIGRQIQKLYSRFPRGHAIGNAIGWTVIALTALVLLLWLLRAAAEDGARPQLDLRGASAEGQNSAYWLRAARAAAAKLDYRSAIHAAYWAGIARLEEAKLLTQDRSRTPRESLRLIGRESAEYGPLAQLTRRFELVWYGYRSASSADWSDSIEQLERLGCPHSSTPAISAS